MAKILVVDDSLFQRNHICKMIIELGHEPTTAENGAVGLEKSKSEQPDCIITDLLMPIMNGIELLKNLHASGSDIPVIVLTADIQEASKSECIEHGARSFLNKPPKKEQFASALKEALLSSERESV